MRDPDEIIRHFVDEIFLPRAVTISPRVPDEMADGHPTRDQWIPWKPIPSPVCITDLSKVEDTYSIELPTLFKRWFTYKCLLMTDFGIAQLPEIRSDEPLVDLERYLKLLDSSDFREKRLIPFANGENDVGPLCFDLAAEADNADHPVVLCDHSLISTKEYRGKQYASNFADLLSMIQADMTSFDSIPPNT